MDYERKNDLYAQGKEYASSMASEQFSLRLCSSSPLCDWSEFLRPTELSPTASCHSFYIPQPLCLFIHVDLRLSKTRHTPFELQPAVRSDKNPTSSHSLN